MNREIFLKYVERNVKLKLKDGFVLYGTITEVFEDCIEFESKQDTSIISFDEISLLVPTRGDY